MKSNSFRDNSYQGARLASDAAIDIEASLMGSRDFSSTYQLAEAIEEAVRNYETNDFWDPMTITVFNKSIKVSGRDVKTVEELHGRMALAAQDLRNIEGVSDNRREELRDFCTGLSKEFHEFSNREGSGYRSNLAA